MGQVGASSGNDWCWQVFVCHCSSFNNRHLCTSSSFVHTGFPHFHCHVESVLNMIPTLVRLQNQLPKGVSRCGLVIFLRKRHKFTSSNQNGWFAHDYGAFNAVSQSESCLISPLSRRRGSVEFWGLFWQSRGKTVVSQAPQRRVKYLKPSRSHHLLSQNQRRRIIFRKITTTKWVSASKTKWWLHTGSSSSLLTPTY